MDDGEGNHVEPAITLLATNHRDDGDGDGDDGDEPNVPLPRDLSEHIPLIVTTNICVTMFLCHCNNKYLDITTFLCHCNNKYL